MRGLIRRLKGAWRADDGATAVEFALVIPVATVFIFGVWYLGWAVNCGSEVRHAVELASRIYVTNPSSTLADLKTAVASHLTDVSINSVTLASSSTTAGTASEQHITWSYQATMQIPVFSNLSMNFSGAVDVPQATAT